MTECESNPESKQFTKVPHKTMDCEANMEYEDRSSNFKLSGSRDGIREGQASADVDTTRSSKNSLTLDASTVELGNVVEESEAPYSIFSIGEKRAITFMVSLTTLFPPLTSGMFYPVITKLATDLHVSISDINLSITLYLIFQGLAPSFLGNLSDELGRRPALVIGFVIYIIGCVTLAAEGTYVTLMITRCLQSAGSSAATTLSFATVSDIVTSVERGSYVSFVQMGWMIGPSLGPVLGGILTQYLGWHSIFWFLSIFSTVVLVACLVFLPETSRTIVGNGSISPQKWNVSLLNYLRLRKQRELGNAPREVTPKAIKPRLNPLNSFKLFLDKENGVLLLYSGMIYAVQYMVYSSMPDQFQRNYHFNTLQISLCYLATGSGVVSAVLFVGRVLDWNFRRHAKRLGLEISKDKQLDLSNFPIEFARLQVALPLLVFAALSLVAYGWSMQAGAPLAMPLIFLFLQAFGNSSAFNCFSGLIVDLNRKKAGTSSAAMNLARNWLGAGCVALINPLINRVGMGWATVIIAGTWLFFSPFVIWTIKCGPRWQEEKRLKEEDKSERHS